MNLHYMNRKMVLNGLCKFRTLFILFHLMQRRRFCLIFISNNRSIWSFIIEWNSFAFLEMRFLRFILIWKSFVCNNKETFKFVLSGNPWNVIWWAWKFIVLCHNVLERKKGNWWEEVCWDYQCMNLNFYLFGCRCQI